MKATTGFLLGVAMLGVTVAEAQAGVIWPDNGHYYEAVLFNGTWAQAKTDAQSKGGYLATIGSAAENAFVFSLVGSNPAFWLNDGANNSQGPWLGGYQRAFPPPTEPDGNWQWDTGELWAYSNWASGEPNNNGGNEDRLQFFGIGLNNPQPTWNDVPQTSTVKGYILEVPEPAETATAAGLLLGALVVWRRWRR